MADTILLRAGNKEGMPNLAQRELAYVKDENALYIGTSDGNKKILSEEFAKKLDANVVASVEALATDADLAAVVSKVNELITALKSQTS